MSRLIPEESTIFTGVGMCTALGLSAQSSFAAFRAGILEVAETETAGIDGEPIRASCLSVLPRGGSRRDRMLALINLALDDLPVSQEPNPELRLSLFMGLPESITSRQSHVSAFLETVGYRIGKRFNLSQPPSFFPMGRSAFFLRCKLAVRRWTLVTVIARSSAQVIPCVLRIR